jgi:hypothetical protein
MRLTTGSENEAVFWLVLSPHIAWLPSVRPFVSSIPHLYLLSLSPFYVLYLWFLSLLICFRSATFSICSFHIYLFLSSIKYSVLSIFLLHVFAQFNLLVTVEIYKTKKSGGGGGLGNYKKNHSDEVSVLVCRFVPFPAGKCRPDCAIKKPGASL